MCKSIPVAEQAKIKKLKKMCGVFATAQYMCKRGYAIEDAVSLLATVQKPTTSTIPMSKRVRLN